MLLPVERIKVPLDSVDKPGILREMCSLLARESGVAEREAEILEAVAEREAVLSTGIGGGVALPHCKSPVLESLALAAGTTREPVDFESLDGEPIQLAVMLVTPTAAAALHVKTLGRISRLLRGETLRRRLFDADTAEEFHRLIVAAEAA